MTGLLQLLTAAFKHNAIQNAEKKGATDVKEIIHFTVSRGRQETDVFSKMPIKEGSVIEMSGYHPVNPNSALHTS